MYIQKIFTNNYQNYKQSSNVSFCGVKEAIDVWQESKPVISEALEKLGDKNISLIMPGNCFPSRENEDFSIGSPYSNGAKDVAEFFDGIFSKCILGPWGKTSSLKKHSPYNSTLESLNPFFINFQYLTTKEGGNLLSKETFSKITTNNPAKSNNVDYDYAENAVSVMLDEAYSTYMQNLRSGNQDAIALKNDIDKFKDENNGIFLDSIFNCLTKENGTSEFKDWNDIDKKLPILLEQNNDQAKKRLSEIENKYSEEIDKYLFTQYLAKEHTKLAPMTYVADKQVALYASDMWKLQDIILDEINGQTLSLGVPGDAFSSKGRCWGIPIIDYKKLFNEDGSLTKGGTRLYTIYRNIFRENKGGVRIDHFQGVIDPFVCVNNSAEVEDGAGRLYSSPNHTLFNSYSIIDNDRIDESRSIYDVNHITHLTDEDIEKYAQFFEKIILAAAKAEGCDETNIMPEDLGSITKPTLAVIAKDNLGSMKVTQFVNPQQPSHMYRGVNSKPQDFITTGTHDNKPLVSYFYDMPEDKYKHHIDMLESDLGIKTEHNDKDRTYGIKLKFAELFAAPAKNVQLFFTHLMGMNSWYNKPGDKTFVKWTLRMPNNYKELYFRNMLNGLAFNPYDALSKALESKNDPQFKPLISKLKKYEEEIEHELDK